MTLEEAKRIMKRTTSVLTAYQLWPKGWSISGKVPDPKIAADGIMLVAGLLWDMLSDTFRIKIPKVYFSRKLKGNMEGKVTFHGETIKELEEFFPEDMTTRALLGTIAKVYDSTGILSPLLGSLRSSLRQAADAGGCKDWDAVQPNEIRKKFIERMFQIELVREMTYPRTQSTEDTIPKGGIL